MGGLQSVMVKEEPVETKPHERTRCKIVKLKFDTVAIRNHKVGEVRQAAKKSGIVGVQKPGELAHGLGLKLARPINLTPDQPVRPTEESLAPKDAVKLVQAPTESLPPNTIERESLLNLNREELGYLKYVALNKYRDVDAEKFHRSKQRYGW